MTDWIFMDEVFLEDVKNYYGFVYLITNLYNGKKYYGKKSFWFSKTKVVKKKTKKFLVESDWKEYTGSSDILNEDVQSLGLDNFRREIIMLCNTKSECSYYEAKYQFENDVLLRPDEYYNSWISCKITRKHLTTLL